MRHKLFSLLSLGLSATGLLIAEASQARMPDSTLGVHPTNVSKSKVNAAQQEAKARFIENAGQWDRDALYLFQSGNLDYWVTKKGVTFDIFEYSRTKGDLNRKGQVVKMEFVNSNSNPQALGVDQKRGFTGFMMGPKDKWVKGARGFNESLVRNVYPNIDFRNYIQGGQARYDVLVKPGANPNTVQFNFSGSNGLEIDEKGNLLIQTDLGAISQARLTVYQEIDGNRVVIPSSFRLMGSTRIGFNIGKYDHSRPLVIDPLVYGTHFGADSFPPFIISPDYVMDTVQDGAGNLYLTGQTASPIFPITAGPYGNFGIQGATDAFLTKLVADSFEYEYSAYIGGTSTEEGQHITIDGSGNVWMAGFTGTNGAPFAGGALQAAYGGGARDIFLVEFKSDIATVLAPNYATYIGGAGSETLGGLEVNQVTGQILIAGDTVNNIPLVPGAVSGGNADAWVLYLNPAGTAVDFGRYIGGTSTVRCGVRSNINMTDGSDVIPVPSMGLATDINGNVVVAGGVSTVGNVDTSTGPGSLVFQTTPNVFPNGRLLRGSDGFIVRMSSTGLTLFAAVLGGSVSDQIRGVATDPFGNIYVTGNTNSFDYPRTRGVFGTNFSTNPHVFITKVASTGAAITYSTNIRSNGPVFPTGIGVDARGIATIGGVVSFTPVPLAQDIPASIPTSADADDTDYNGGDEQNPPVPPTGFSSTVEGFVFVLNSNATEDMYSSYVGEDGNDIVNSIYTIPAGSFYASGTTRAVFNGNGEAKGGGIGAGFLSPDALKAQADDLGDGFFFKYRVGLATVSQLTFNPTVVPGGLGAFSTGTVTLAAPAPTGGAVVRLELNNVAIASFDAVADLQVSTLTIPAGAQTGTFSVYTRAVVVPTTCQVKAGIDGDYKAADLTVAPWLNELSLLPDTIVGGNDGQARIRLLQPAPVGGVDVDLSTNAPGLITLPAGNKVHIDEGNDSVTFTFQTLGVTATTPVNITAAFLGANRTQTLNLLAASLLRLTFTPSSVTTGDSAVGLIELNGKAGAPIDLTLTHTGANVAHPATVTIPAQQRSISFTATAPFVVADTSSVIKAQRLAPNQSVQATLFIVATDIASVSIDATPIPAGTSITGRVQLTAPAGPGGFIVDIAHSNPAAGSLTSTTVTVPGGSLTSNDFTFNAAFVSTQQTTIITASKAGGFTARSVSLVVNPVDLGLNLVFNPNPVPGVSNTTGTLSIAAAAPVALTFNLSANPASAVGMPATVTIPQGDTSASFTVTTNQVAADTTVAVTAARGGQTIVGSLTVLSAGVQSIVLNPNTIHGNETTLATITLNQPAPAGGLTINLSAFPAALVTMPAQITIPAGATTGSFTITAHPVSRNSAVLITATVPNKPAASTYLFIAR